jgi:hypothetical protein
MTASQIIGEIAALPMAERAEVIRFARSLDAEHPLSGNELAALAERLPESTSPAQVSLLRDQIECGFYGQRPHA